MSEQWFERDPLWFKHAVFYEIHIRGFFDGNDDGSGDFRGLIDKLDYLEWLGVDCLWLLPMYESPLRDGGYDISNFFSIHPDYGSVEDFREFVEQAHQRGMRVIADLVMNHTSQDHPWFQESRADSTNAKSDWYVWSDTDERYPEARVIFIDTEPSNWTFDQLRGEYYWHRFFHHQPDLNYDNLQVQEAMLEVLRFWLDLGIDGFRLDAVPYLFERDGTNGENLPETHEYLKRVRAEVDARYPDRLLLAEANQWPEDVVDYFGDGDECQMCFHFPVMPRMFMSLRREDATPMYEILDRTPKIPNNSQWGLFLRNHDELTLEMVTDEERDYMYRAYAQDPQARVNVGIRRRLAPLLGNDRTLIEMMNGLLFSMPGTPIIYYGDEIGMGDNIYLGDRNAVRTPMQWNSDRNAGFSDANPQRLFLPVIIDPEYHSQAINVEAQTQNPNSLLWWMRRAIALRQRYKAFGRGSLEILLPDNRKVFAFIRRLGEERILCVFNLSRHVQCAELDLSEFRGAVPVELSGNQEFPPIGDLPYFITLGSHGFFWFSLECEPEQLLAGRPSFAVSGPWTSLFEGPTGQAFESWLETYLAERRWFGQKTRTITSASIVEAVPVPSPPHGYGNGSARDAVATILIVQLEFDQGASERYTLPVAFVEGFEAEEMKKWQPEAVMADLHAQGHDGVLLDATHSPEFVKIMADLLARRRTLPGRHGQIVGLPSPSLRRDNGYLRDDLSSTPLSGEQSNSSVLLGDQAIMKFIRRFEEGVNPGVEISRFLSEHGRFDHAPRAGGSIEYRGDALGSTPATVSILEQYVPNEGDGWQYVVDALTLGLEDALATPVTEHASVRSAPTLQEEMADPVHPLVGPHLEWASLLGRRTAEMHVALAGEQRDTNFVPEPLTSLDRQALFHGARSLTRQVLRDVVSRGTTSPLVDRVLKSEDQIIERLRRLSAIRVEAFRIRCHGDYHLGQVLWTGKDFVVIDFEGEPSRSLGWRRLKRPAAFDLAGMVRSLHYAGQAAALRVNLEFGASSESGQRGRLADWLTIWHRDISAQFMSSYLELAQASPFLPSSQEDLECLLDFFRLEKAMYELGYEVNTRPTWVDVPARGILDILGSE
jgi:maltose alpha-D-glucosyltransferase/alpha-amylase